jgi:hypothetical protein
VEEAFFPKPSRCRLDVHLCIDHADTVFWDVTLGVERTWYPLLVLEGSKFLVRACNWSLNLYSWSVFSSSQSHIIHIHKYTNTYTLQYLSFRPLQCMSRKLMIAEKYKHKSNPFQNILPLYELEAKSCFCPIKTLQGNVE